MEPDKHEMRFSRKGVASCGGSPAVAIRRQTVFHWSECYWLMLLLNGRI